jgi:glyoxylase-like metal-dependent hydrolase (beta-lactamase superfamily II)
MAENAIRGAGGPIGGAAVATPAGITTIDTGMLGEPGVTGSWLVQGERTALVETGPRSSLHNVLSALADMDVDRLDVIAVTHIHLDHAGGAGTLAQLFETAVVAVHEAGAPHLVDPSRLWSSASRIYGTAMEEMWGGIDPVDPGRIRTLSDGDVIDLGGASLRVLATPGHASHHHAFLEETSGTVFAGDALGVRLPDLGVVRPATPPPEFDLDAAIASIERLAGLGAARLVLTHFGPSEEGALGLSPAEMCERAIEAVRRWADWARSARAETNDVETASRSVERAARAGPEAGLSPSQVARLEKTTTYRMNTWGLLRYLGKNEQSP